MALVINTNMLSLNAQRNLSKTGEPLHVAMQRLSSGLRINSAKDDAAGMAMATRMDVQIRGLTVALRNSNDGLSFIQTAEGAVSEMIGDISRMFELSVQAASNNTDTDRKAIDAEVQELIKELNRVVDQTRYNGELFLNKQVSWNYQVGAEVGETISMDTTNLSPTAMGITTTHDPKWTAQDVATGAWSTYKAGEKGDFNNEVSINGVHLGGAMPKEEIMNNSKALIDRVNKYTKETNIKAMSYGNAVVAKSGITLSSGGASGQAGFLTINGVEIGAFAKGQVKDGNDYPLTSDAKKAELEKALQDAKNPLKSDGTQKTPDELKADVAKATANLNNANVVPPPEEKRTALEKALEDAKNPIRADGTQKTPDELKADVTQATTNLNKEIDAENSNRKKIENATAKNIVQAINDKASETGVSATVVSNSRLVLSNISGGGISYMVDVSRLKSDKGDATKDIDLGLNLNGENIVGGKNGLVVFNDNRFGQGSLEFNSIATSNLFGYGAVEVNGIVQNAQKKTEVTNNISLSRRSVNDLSITSAESAKITMLVTQEVLDFLNSFKAVMGAKMNRIESTVRNLDNVRENLTAAKSRVLDADFAQESANLTKSLILQQAGISVLAQANVLPQNVLSLLQGK
jgi:flagellin